MKIIIDTDPGHDDAMALMLGLKSAKLDVLAVTTVAGNSTIENCTRNARYVLDLIGSKVPIYSGASAPLERDLVKAVVHGQSGLDGIDPDSESGLTGDAVDQIIRLTNANERGEVTLVTLGPLTNVAQAILRAPESMKRLKQIVAMGGAIEAPGNKNRVAEFNMFVDPEAAEIVFESDIPLTIVPLDACNDIKIPLDDFKSVNDTKLREVLLKMNGAYINNLLIDEGSAGALMYDALTVYYLLEPENCSTINLSIKVETRGKLTRGMTVADRRPITDGTPSNVEVVTYVDEKKFRKRFFDALE